jgi:DNA-binding beta-propeller fold protein YncE
VFALIYLLVMIILGDIVCRRFCRYVSTVHRWAMAFLAGLVLSTWATYLAARLFASSTKPLLYGNFLFFIVAIATIYLLNRKKSRATEYDDSTTTEASKDNRLDWVATAVFFVVATWMMFSSLNMRAGNLQIANHQWSDFGPNIALMQSFAMGKNFPTEYPHFAGDRIRYHFLFYFQAGNLEYLGFNPALSNNILSVLSLVSMLLAVMALGSILFSSRAVGRIGAVLFFFHGSLAYMPFLRSQESLNGAVKAITTLNAFLPTGFPYRGEDWGMWSLLNFINQRHFASGIGIFLLVLAFVIQQYRAKELKVDAATLGDEVTELREEHKRWSRQWFLNTLQANRGFLFFGVLIGLLPMWNGAVFIAAVVVFLGLLVFFRSRVQVLMLLASAALVAMPQIIYLRTGNIRPSTYSLFHWGYTIANPTVLNVSKYLGFTFGLKWLFIGLALIWMSWFQRRMVLVVTSLVGFAFLFQFSEEVLANHKFLNVWLIVANLFVAYGIWRLWNVTRPRLSVRIGTIALVFLTVLGGVIDLFPIHRAYWAEISFEGDPLLRWTQEHTDARAVFLSDRFVNHQILLAGRRIFFGWPYYSWGAGYKTDEREAIYRQLFEEREPSRLMGLLQQNNISYVAIDDGLRSGNFISKLNEAVYENNFEKVFSDSEHRYGGLSIFRVPQDRRPELGKETRATAADEPNLPASNAFNGGRGIAHGQFASARGLAVDHAGNIYVADTGNARVQKFSGTGEFLAAIGRAGAGLGQLKNPVGVAVDSEGAIYVTDAGTHQLIKFGGDGQFIAQWGGPPPGFYGPLDVAIGTTGNLYVVDQGRARIVIMDRTGNTIKEWGKKGTGPGEFDDPTGVAVGGDRVYVADEKNNRIQVFDLEGKFLLKWQIPEWAQDVFHNPDVFFDAPAKRVYVSSGVSNEVLVFDADGKEIGRRKSTSPVKFNRPSGLALAEAGAQRRLYVMNTDGANLSWIDLPQDSSSSALHSVSAATVSSRNN